MKKVLMLVVLLVATATAAHAQKKVEVSQEFIDSANRSFMELVLSRQAVVSLESALKAKDEVVAAKNETIKLQMEQIEMYRKLKCDKTSFLFGVIKNTRCH